MTEAKRGRPTGSRNKSLVVRTNAIREAVSVDDCVRMAKNLLDMAFDETISPSDRIKAQALLMKYVAHSADVELIADSEAKAPSPEALTKAAQLIDALKAS